MKRLIILSIIASFFFPLQKTNAQEVKKLTFDEVIKLAEEQSPNALMAKHRFRASYWQYRTFIAQYRPSLTLTGSTPDYSTAYSRVWDAVNQQYDYISTNILQTIGSVSLTQNIGLTGGTISLQSDLTLENDLDNDSHKFITAPVSVRLMQPVFRYNQLKWEKKTEPLRYESAKKTFLENMEMVHIQAVQNFFSLALAQINKQIAEMNYLNADTLWRMAQGRYNLGTIAEDEMLQMKLSWLNSETSRKQAEMNLRDREIRLRSFLGFNETVRLQLILPTQIPDLQLEPQEVLKLAYSNNPEMLDQQLTLLTAKSNVAQAKAEKGLNANLTASYGLRDQDPVFANAYSQSNRQQTVRLGVTLPILDWGLGQGRYRMAQSSLELAQVQYEQALVDFEQNLLLDVEQFNLQSEQVRTAAMSDTVATRMYQVAKQRFLIGKIAVLELNNADTRKDENRRAYVMALQNYWNYFFNIRSLALYDFINSKPLESDYEKLIE